MSNTLFTASALGKEMAPLLKAAEVNKLLADKGYIERDLATGHWQLTVLGERYGKVAAKATGLSKWKKVMIRRLQGVDLG